MSRTNCLKSYSYSVSFWPRASNSSGLLLGARAVQIADGGTSNYFLTTFGRANRITVCTCDVKSEPTLSQALHLINGGTVQSKIQSGGVIKKMLDEGRSNEEVVDALYVRCLCRKPTPDEQQRLLAIVAEAPDTSSGLEDVFWALLNSREFLFNH